MGRVDRRGDSRSHVEADRLEDVEDASHRRRSLTDQPVRPHAGGARDLPGHGHHLPSLLERHVGGDERARALAGLHDDGDEAQSGDDAIACGKAPRRRLDARLVLAHDEPARCDDPPGELRVRRRVVAIDAAAEHRDRRPAPVEGAPMGFAVDPSRKPAHHHGARGRHLTTERPRDATSVRGAGTCPDDRDRRTAEQAQVTVAANPERRGRVVDRAEQRRICAVAEPEPPSRHRPTSRGGR